MFVDRSRIDLILDPSVSSVFSVVLPYNSSVNSVFYGESFLQSSSLRDLRVFVVIFLIDYISIGQRIDNSVPNLMRMEQSEAPLWDRQSPDWHECRDAG